MQIFGLYNCFTRASVYELCDSYFKIIIEQIVGHALEI